MDPEYITLDLRGVNKGEGTYVVRKRSSAQSQAGTSEDTQTPGRTMVGDRCCGLLAFPGYGWGGGCSPNKKYIHYEDTITILSGTVPAG